MCAFYHNSTKDGLGEAIQETTQELERYVGQRIRERRTMLGLTQQKLAEMVGVTYQQAHKYERGINRISAGRLFELSQVLGVSVGFFFDGASAPSLSTVSERQRMSLDIARNFAKIKEERMREALAQLCRAMAENASTESDGTGAPEGQDRLDGLDSLAASDGLDGSNQLDGSGAFSPPRDPPDS